MAEEIVQTWDSINKMLIELITSDEAIDIRKVRDRIQLTIEDPASNSAQTMTFRLVDKNGNDVAFPLQLISDTTFGPPKF